MLLSDAPEIFNVIVAVLILSVNFQVCIAIVWSWLMEVFGDNSSDESEEAKEGTADQVTDNVPGLDDDNSSDPIMLCLKSLAKKVIKCGILQLVLLVPFIIMGPLSRMRRSIEGTVPLFRWKGWGWGVDILTHRPKDGRQKCLRQFSGWLLRSFYNLSDESQRAFAAEVTGSMTDHLLTNAGFNSMPSGLLDFQFAFPTVLARAQEKFPPPQKLTLPMLLAEANNYVLEVRAAGYAKEATGQASRTRSSSTIDAAFYEDREGVEHAISAEQMNAGLLFLHRLPPAELHDLVSGFLCTLEELWSKTDGGSKKLREMSAAEDEEFEADVREAQVPNPIRIPTTPPLMRPSGH
mmetsp:Transcript_37007/g.78480  ORF Transcript_37007/g.78480 Transcript_37007/m.78480 type:complete len:350 (-) Transcript_37007:135-1184(-)